MATVGVLNPVNWLRRPTELERFIAEHADSIKAAAGPIILFAGTRTPETLAYWRDAFRDRLHVISEHDVMRRVDGATYESISNPDAILAHLTSLPPIAAIIDEGATNLLERMNRWQKFFFTLGRGGYYISPKDYVETAWEVGIATLTADRKPPAEARALQAAAGISIESWGYTITGKGNDHWFKLKDENANRVLPTRNPDVTVEILEELDGGTYESALTTVQHGARMPVFGPKINYNPVWNRVYHGPVTAASHMLAYSGKTILPSSFRHPRVGNVPNEKIESINREYAVIDGGERRSEPLDGRFYDLSSSIPGHFGHIMTETIPKLWGWDAAKAAYPDMKVLYRIPSNEYDPKLERALFGAYGIPEEDIRWETKTKQVDTFASPSLLWQNAAWYHFHPRLLEVWQRLRDGLVIHDASRPKNVFISRKHVPGNRSCRNVEDVEVSFARRGFEIVYPETLPFEEQVNVFANARNLAGFAGSGMFNMLFNEHLQNVILLTHESYTARNEQLYASSTANTIHYFWSPSDVKHPKGGFSNKAFQSPWEFDYDRNGAALDELLLSL